MNEFEDIYRTSGQVVPSGFPEFDNLTGYEVGVYASQWTDKDGTVYLRTTTIVNLGKPDRGAVLDPDRLLERERLSEGYEWLEVSRNACTNKRLEREQEVAKRIEAYLQEHEPASPRTLWRALGWGETIIRRVLVSNPDKFVQVSHGVYGRVGHKHEKKITPAGESVIAYLTEHGPSSVREIADALSIQTNTFHWLNKMYPGLFHTVRIRPAHGISKPTRIWGVVGVHEQEAA